jgi:hypothetical protein
MIRIYGTMVLALLGCIGCSDRSIPPDAQLLCATSSECPRGFVCEAGRCEDADGNRPPRLALALPARAVDTIPVALTVFDGNSDRVTLTAEVVDGTERHALSPAPTGVDAPADGAVVDVVLPAPPLAAGPLPRVVSVRLFADDGIRTASAEGELLYGNAAPVLLDLDAVRPRVGDADAADDADDADDARGTVVGGVIDLGFLAQDSSSDPFDVIGFAFAVDAGPFVDVDLAAPAFVADELTGQETSPTGLPRLLSWNTAGLPLHGEVRVRLTVRDTFGAEASVESAPFAVDNRPRVGARLTDESGRPLATQGLVVTVDDPNSEAVTVRVERSFDFAPESGAGSFAEATAAADSGSLVDVIAGTEFRWDVAADVPVALVATAGDSAGGPVPIPVPVLVPVFTTAFLRVTATDATGLVAAPVVVGPVVVGNEPPALTSFVPPVPGAGGAVAIAFSVADAAGDDASVEVQFRQDPTDAWRAIRVLAGVVDDLPTTATPSAFLVLWDSLAAVNDDVTVPQGIGRQFLPRAGLRVRTFDEVRAGERHFSAWQEATVSLSNQSPPRAEPVFVAEQGGVRSGVLPIVWRAIDLESDPVHAAFEFSTDGVLFTPCTEARTAHSEGVHDLASAPEAAGGVAHTFLWDVATDVAARAAVEVRVRVADAFSDLAAARPSTLVSAAPWDPAPGHDALFTRRDLPGLGEAFPVLDLGDWDGDGDVDLAITAPVGNFFENTLELREGDGRGNFTTRASLVVDGAPHLVDLDRDGRRDVFLDRGTLVRGNGVDFSVDDRVVVFACAGFCTADLHDLDGDGAIDVVLDDHQDGQTRLLRGVGVGAAFAFVEGDALPGLSFDTRVGDVDGDGDRELVRAVGSPRAFEVWDLPVDGDGVLHPALRRTIPTDPPRNDLGLVDVVDMTGDGRADVVALDQRLGDLLLFASRADETLAEIARASTVSFPLDTASADLNDDGVTDFVIPTVTERDVVVVYGRQEGGRPAGGFLDPVRLRVGDVQGSVAVADIDGNGRDDIVTAVGLAQGFLASFLQPSSFPATAASFGAARAVSDPGLASASPAVADVNGDGALDLVLSVELGTPTIARGRATGAITTTFASPPLPVPGSVNFAGGRVVADLDADGRVDVVGWRLDGLRCFFESHLGRDDGTFALVQSTAGASCGGDLAAGDIDGDDIVDLAGPPLSGAGGWGAFFGNGDGTFSAREIPLAIPGAALVGHAVGDLDADGLDDVVVTPEQNVFDAPTLPLAVYRGRADRTFAAPEFFDVVGGAGLVRIADIDSDGHSDIVAMRQSGPGDRLQVLRGSGVGTAWTVIERLVSSVVLPGTSTRFRPVLSDVDVDGILDLAWSEPSPGTHPLSLLPGRAAQAGGDVGGGDLLPAIALPASRNLGDVVAVDVSGDGQPDLVSAEYYGGAATVSQGRRAGVGGVTRTVAARDGSGAQAFGPGVADTVDVDGVPESPAISIRRVAGADDILAGVPAGAALGDGGDFAALLRRDGVTVGRRHRPLTGAFYVAGDVTLRRVAEPAGGFFEGTRLQLAPRLGPLVDAAEPRRGRTGLDLAGPTPRGVVVDVPFLQGRTPAGAVRVLVRVPTWRTADLFTGADPLAEDDDAGRFLPRIVDDDGGPRDVVLLDYAWLDVPEGDGVDFASDGIVGPRFHVDVAGRRVRVLLDRFGAVQAFDLP